MTEIAGTTRDQLHERLTIGDIPISLIDTAGLRETHDTVEVIGVERSRRCHGRRRLGHCHVRRFRTHTDEDTDILKSVTELNHLVVFNKMDKIDEKAITTGTKRFSSAHPSEALTVAISAKTGAGLDELKQAIVRPFRSDETSTAGFLVSDARHHDLLKRASIEIDQSLESLEARPAKK